MRVLVFGATGFIGHGVAKALALAGHSVIGQTRSQKSAIDFYKEEIEPLVIDADADTAWTKLIPTLDAVIDCSSSDPQKLFEAGLQKFQRAEQAAKSRDPTAAKLIYIYTSGTWVQGTSSFEQRFDGSAITTPSSLTAWRTQIEVPLRSSTILNGIVVRPSLLYGRSASIIAQIFAQAANDQKITWPGSQATTLSTIHVDDLAQLYRLAVEKASLVAGQVLDGTLGVQESLHVILLRLAELEGFSSEKITYTKPSNAWEEALVTSRPLRPSAGRTLLGWQPVHASITDGLPTYYNAFKANNGIQPISYLPK